MDDLVEIRFVYPSAISSPVLMYRCRVPVVDSSGSIAGFGDYGEWKMVENVVDHSFRMKE